MHTQLAKFVFQSSQSSHRQDARVLACPRYPADDLWPYSRYQTRFNVLNGAIYTLACLAEKDGPRASCNVGTYDDEYVLLANERFRLFEEASQFDMLDGVTEYMLHYIVQDDRYYDACNVYQGLNKDVCG